MKLLLDENISKTVTKRLEDAGFDVAHVVERGLLGKPDEKVMEVAIKESRVIVTHDKDFGNLLRFPLQKHTGVIMMRFRNQSPRHIVSYLLNFLIQNAKLPLRARLVILKEEGWRII